VSGKPGSITLYYNPEKTLTPLASTSASFDNKNVKKTEVEAVTLEQIMDEYNLDRIDLLKLDCEGAEYDILYNAPTHLFDKIGMMTMEVHNGDVPRENLEDLKKFLTDLGYQIRTRGDDFVWAWRP
jgi:FkbM family methyltransferase